MPILINYSIYYYVPYIFTISS